MGFYNSLDRRIDVWKEIIISNLKNLKTLDIFTETSIDREKLISGAKSFFRKAVWDEMEDLEKKDLEDQADQKLLGYFDHLRESRNSLNHPDLRLDCDQAEFIFNFK